MAPPQEGQNPLISLIPWIGIFVVFYFFMIRPQMKKNKELKKFRENLKQGDKVVTMSGIHGRLKDIDEDTVVLELENGKVRVDKSTLSPSGKAVPQK
ncbi:MAG: preprotein translocase subunit YajC [Luteibaculum sp.]